MSRLEFDELCIEKTQEGIAVSLYKIFKLEITEAELARLGKYSVVQGGIEFHSLKEAKRKFLFLLNSKMHKLKNKLTGNNATYIHKNLGVPLIGNISFGIVDRGSSLLEIKPITSCVLNCIYCSVAEGRNSNMHDYVIEESYLVDEVAKLAQFKAQPIECHINCQGEPLLYSKLTELIHDLKAIPLVEKVSFNTNGVLLKKENIDKFIEAGLDQINISMNALDKALATRLAGSEYPIEHVKQMIEYITQKKLPLIIAPVMIPGFNETEIPKLIKFAKHLDARIGIQNFLEYKHGKRPARQYSWEKFHSMLKVWEKQFSEKLKFSAEDFNISDAKELPKPWKVGDVLKARIICPGRYAGEAIVAMENRSITVITNKQAGDVKFKLLRTKHNIYLGKAT